MSREYNLNHLPLSEAKNQMFVSPLPGPRPEYPPNRNREKHIAKLKSELNEVIENFEKNNSIYENREAELITIEGKEGYDLKSKSAADKNSGSEILKEEEKDDVNYAVVRVTKDGFEKIFKKMNEYKNETTLFPINIIHRT